MKVKKRTLKYILPAMALGLCSLVGGTFLSQKIRLALAKRNRTAAPAVDGKFSIRPHDSSFYDSQWGAVAYRQTGAGKPLLLLHSIAPGASQAEWDRVVEPLSKFYQVYTLDFPGFGESVLPEKPWSAYQLALLLRYFIKDVIGRPTSVAGANGGADIALTATMLEDHNIERLILISPEGFQTGFPSAEDTEQLKKLLSPVVGTELFLRETNQMRIRHYLEEAFYDPAFVTDAMVANLSAQARLAQSTYAGLTTGFWRIDSLRAFTQLTIPFLLLWGEENLHNSIQYMEEAQKLKTYGTFSIFEKTGAFAHIENSGSFVQEVQQFLK